MNLDIGRFDICFECTDPVDHYWFELVTPSKYIDSFPTTTGVQIRAVDDKSILSRSFSPNVVLSKVGDSFEDKGNGVLVVLRQINQNRAVLDFIKS
jgi:hypothetical protein